MSMKDEWRSVSTRSGELFAVGHIDGITPTTGELQMEELFADNWDTKNLASLSCVMYLEVTPTNIGSYYQYRFNNLQQFHTVWSGDWTNILHKRWMFWY